MVSGNIIDENIISYGSLKPEQLYYDRPTQYHDCEEDIMMFDIIAQL